MSESPSLDPPARRSGPRHRGRRPDDTDAIGRLRSRLLRVSLASVATVILLGIAGLSVVAANRSLGILVTACVVAGCVVVVLAAANWANGAVRAIAQHRDSMVETASQAFGDEPDKQPWADTTEVTRSMFENDPDQRREVFGKLARRLQSLTNRGIQKIDELEREIEDPDLLKGLYEVDHLATRVRRQAENLAVLGGEAPQRRSSSPVSVYAVLRSAVAEVEHYQQVTIVPIEGVSLRGHAVAEIVHLLAELLENATNFSAPDSGKVVLRAQKVTAGLAIEAQDRGLGMTDEDLQRVNRLLDGSAHIDIGDLLKDGRIGLAVVRELARRHEARVQMQTNIFGGIDAVVVLPHSLLGDPRQDTEPPVRSQPARQETHVEPPVTAPAAAPAIPGPVSGATPPPAAPPEERHKITGSLTTSPERELAQGLTAEPQDRHAPVLPVREPGTAFAPGSSAPTAEPYPAGEHSRPPLPQRRGQSHLRQELREPPAHTRPIPGHNPGLMATFQHGLDRGREEQEGANWSQAPFQSNHGSIQGDSPHDR